MINREQLQGHWNEVKGRLKEKWGGLTDDDLVRAEGNVEQLVGVVQRKTGQARETVERFLDEVIAGGGSSTGRAAATARQYVDDARGAMQEGYDRAAESLGEGYQSAQENIRRNPVESVAIGFGAGMLAGLFVGLIMKGR